MPPKTPSPQYIPDPSLPMLARILFTNPDEFPGQKAKARAVYKRKLSPPKIDNTTARWTSEHMGELILDPAPDEELFATFQDFCDSLVDGTYPPDPRKYYDSGTMHDTEAVAIDEEKMNAQEFLLQPFFTKHTTVVSGPETEQDVRDAYLVTVSRVVHEVAQEFPKIFGISPSTHVLHLCGEASTKHDEAGNRTWTIPEDEGSNAPPSRTPAGGNIPRIELPPVDPSSVDIEVVVEGYNRVRNDAVFRGHLVTDPSLLQDLRLARDFQKMSVATELEEKEAADAQRRQNRSLIKERNKAIDADVDKRLNLLLHEYLPADMKANGYLTYQTNELGKLVAFLVIEFKMLGVLSLFDLEFLARGILLNGSAGSGEAFLARATKSRNLSATQSVKLTQRQMTLLATLQQVVRYAACYGSEFVYLTDFASDFVFQMPTHAGWYKKSPAKPATTSAKPATNPPTTESPPARTTIKWLARKPDMPVRAFLAWALWRGCAFERTIEENLTDVLRQAREANLPEPTSEEEMEERLYTVKDSKNKKKKKN